MERRDLLLRGFLTGCFNLLSFFGGILVLFAAALMLVILVDHVKCQSRAERRLTISGSNTRQGPVGQPWMWAPEALGVITNSVALNLVRQLAVGAGSLVERPVAGHRVPDTPSSSNADPAVGGARVCRLCHNPSTPQRRPPAQW